MQALDIYCDENEMPGVVVTAVSRDPDFYPAGRFSWHLVDCGVDIRTHHYSRDQLHRVEAWILTKCRSAGWEVITKQHGTGPHIHIAWKEKGLRDAYEAKKLEQLKKMAKA